MVIVGGTDGAEALATKSCSCICCCFRIGIAEAIVEVDGWKSSDTDEGDIPLGDAIEEGTMKSSKFIESPACPAAWSADWRNCRAIPLGGFGLPATGLELVLRSSLRERG